MDEKPPPRNLLRYATVGIEFLLVFLAFLFAGWALDRWIGWTRPAVTVLGAIVGFSVAMGRLWKQGWGIMQSARREDRDDGGPGGG
jgi:hypothetical protein